MAAGTPQRSGGADIAGDSLRDGYSTRADDGTRTDRTREAAMLFSAAEGHLDAEDYAEALSAANDALAAFRELEDARGVADAIRVAVHAHRGISDNALVMEDDQTAANALRSAEELAREELKAFRSSRDKRGEASMLLAIAEVLYEQKGEKQIADALVAAEDALALFSEIEEPKMEAMACVVLARARFDAKHTVAAKRAGNDAVTLFKALGDQRREATAWGCLSGIYAMDFCYDEAIRCERRRYKLAVEAVDMRQQAVALHLIANWSLVKNDTATTLTSANKALAIFRQIDKANELWEASTLGIIADTYVFKFEPKSAVDILMEALDRFRARGEKHQLLRIYYHLISAHQADENYEEALACGMEALALCREIHSVRSEAKVLESIAYVHISRNSFEEARTAAYESVEVMRGYTSPMEAHHQEAYCKAHMFILAKILVHIDQHNEAVRACEEALRIARDCEDRCLEGQALLAVCGAQAMSRNYEKALKAGELAAEVFHEIGGNYRIDQAKAWQSLAEIHFANGEVQQAMKAILTAEGLLQTFGDKRRLAKMKHSRVNILQAVGERQEAVKVAVEALKLSRSADDMPSTVESIFRAIEAYVEMLSADSKEGEEEKKPRRVFFQQCEKAVRLAKEAVCLSMKTNDKASEGTAYNWVAHLNIMQANMADAIEAAEMARSLFIDWRDKAGQAHSLTLVAQAEMGRENSAAATQCLNDAMALAREIPQTGMVEFIRELQTTLFGKPAARTTEMAPLEAKPAAAPSHDMGASSAGGLDAYRAPDADVVKQAIMSMVQNMVGSSENVDGDTPLMDSGVDSLASVELRTQMQSQFHVNLPSTVMFNYPTISGMTDFLVEEMTNKKITWSA